MAKMGRPAFPREVRVAFWDGVRSGLGVEEAAAAAGVSRNAGWRWVQAAGGVKAPQFPDCGDCYSFKPLPAMSGTRCGPPAEAGAGSKECMVIAASRSAK